MKSNTWEGSKSMKRIVRKDRVSFTLDKETVRAIKEISNYIGVKQSQLINFILSDFDRQALADAARELKRVKQMQRRV